MEVISTKCLFPNFQTKFGGRKGVTNLTSPESDTHPSGLANEMPEVNEGNPVPSSSASSKENKASS